MLVIRLARHGRKNWPTYRLVLQEKDWAPMSKAIETLGTMDPHTNPTTIVLKTERISYWLGKGAQPSTTVHNLLVNAGMIKAEKQRSVTGATPAKFVVATPVAAPVEATVEAAVEATPAEPTAPVAA